MNKVLLLDWGIGGLSVLNELKRARPDLSCLYISDSGFTPYGKVPAPELAARVAAIIAHAQRKYPVTQTVIACNAASTVLAEVKAQLRQDSVLGVIAAGVELVQESGKKKIGVIGGRRTIDSKIFSAALKGTGQEVHEQVAQPLSALIEAGVLSGPALAAELKQILTPLREVEALLLACTHYPAVAGEIQRILPEAALLDPAARAAQHLASRISEKSSGAAEDLFFTTGDIAGTERTAHAAFGIAATFHRWETPDAR